MESHSGRHAMSANKSGDTILKCQPRVTSKGLAGALILATLLGMTGCSGCSRPAIVARFDHGLFFTSWEGNEYQHVEWFRKEKHAAGRGMPDPADPCPIVIHFREIDLDEKKLVDRKTLEKLGFKEEDFGMVFGAENYFIAVYFASNGVLSSISVGLRWHCREDLEGIISINGQRMSLPISEEELVRLLGKPKAKTKVAG